MIPWRREASRDDRLFGGGRLSRSSRFLGGHDGSSSIILATSHSSGERRRGERSVFDLGRDRSIVISLAANHHVLSLGLIYLAAPISFSSPTTDGVPSTRCCRPSRLGHEQEGSILELALHIWWVLPSKSECWSMPSSRKVIQPDGNIYINIPHFCRVELPYSLSYDPTRQQS